MTYDVYIGVKAMSLRMIVLEDLSYKSFGIFEFWVSCSLGYIYEDVYYKNEYFIWEWWE